ncbi:MAG: hypothetical protein IKW48_09325 [Akkermansia sp.]|nr:hypothetical protein [Akkermansia sp.]
MRIRMQNRRISTPYCAGLPLLALLSVIGGGGVLVVVFLLALVYSAVCLAPGPVAESSAVATEEPILLPRQCRMVPEGPEISVLPAMSVTGAAAHVSLEQAMQEMEGLVATEPPHDIDFSMLQMELLGDFDGWLPASVLWGTFYDLSRNKGGAPTGLVNGKELESVVKNYLNSRDWGKLARFYRFPPTLYSSCFLRSVADTACMPGEFRWQSGQLPPAWVAAYRGRVKSPVSGTIRFIGTGDVYLAVCFNSRVVLESGSCLASTQKSENPEKLAVGTAIKVKEGEVYSVLVILAGSGNEAGFGLLWEHVSGKSAAGSEGVLTDARYYLFRTSFCTPYADGDDGALEQCGQWPAFNPDSPIWMVVP